MSLGDRECPSIRSNLRRNISVHGAINAGGMGRHPRDQRIVLATSLFDVVHPIRLVDRREDGTTFLTPVEKGK